ncbi:short-chain dehydrogenase [Hungatella sp. L12]|uniref:Short-chain dehydrogenase n=1 Tax=Hungatella hominis TaxID=2763050 RepID=A0ABR7H0M2_9FIRM|nr:short-chain dehydrogenase [Hungatella hominis]MBC5706747.1 short-chain dehydrogenase [Hungatella hominis]
MAKQESGFKANIGSSSLILIFIVMCLVTFGMLSLTSAKSDLSLANRNADAVTEYYRADTEGEAFYRMVAGEVKAACTNASGHEERLALLEKALGEYYRGGAAVTEVAMERAQALHIELEPDLDGEGSVRVAKWNVIQTEDYEIDDSMPVWGGTADTEQK